MCYSIRSRIDALKVSEPFQKKKMFTTVTEIRTMLTTATTISTTTMKHQAIIIIISIYFLYRKSRMKPNCMNSLDGLHIHTHTNKIARFVHQMMVALILIMNHKSVHIYVRISIFFTIYSNYSNNTNHMRTIKM